jgi:hypothetical protein
MKEKTKTTKSIHLPPTRVREDLRDRIRDEAERKQTSVSALVREAIIQFLRGKKKGGQS